MVGQHIGKYRVTEQIGRGGMGTVYRAIDETLQREVAIKVLNAELSDPTVARRFRAEAVTVARLNHPGIATIYELLQHDGQWLMVMEFLRGETLESMVARKGSLAVDLAADLIMQTLAALAHAHSLGVVHRDLKPANLMVAQNGLIKIMDFGIARVAGAEQLTSAGFMMGTPAYMAPEQVLGQDIDARTDLYAIGLVFYYLVTGRLPFGGTTPLDMAQARIHDQPTPIGATRPDVPAWVGRVIDIALAREPERRFQTALLFREALRRGLANLPIETPAPAVVPPELVATAAPSSLPVLESRPIEVVKHTQPPPADVPTVAARLPVDPARPAPNRLVLAGAGMAALLVVVLGVVFFMRPGDAPASAAPGSGSGVVAEAPLDVTPVADPTAAATSSITPPPAPAVAETPDAVARGANAPAAPVARDGTTAAGSPNTSPAAPARGSAGTAAGTGTAAAARGGRGTPAAEVVDTPLVFKDVRAFVVTGRRVDERDAALRFGDGRVTLTDSRGQTTFGTLAYADITAASHTRAKNPRWYPTLAGPPSNVDMPGGLFRQDRHWLTLQSRSGYLIVRLSDSDAQRVIDTVNARLRVDVERLAPRDQ